MKTPLSLLERLRRPDDQEAWRRFVQFYAPLLYSWGRRLHFSPDDAADLVQEVFVQLVRKLPEFRLDPGKRFRNWLWAVTKNKCLELRRRRVAEPNMEAVANLAIDDPIAQLDQAEYHQHLVSHALQIMQQDFEPSTWRAGWEVIGLRRPVEEVARELKLSRNAVYIAKYRVIRRLRELLDGLLD